MSRLQTVNVNRFLQWRQVLLLLGIDPVEEGLPCTVRCPGCNELQLVIYQDTIEKGQWHHCRSCGIAGDMVQLAAKAWKVSEAEAIADLAAQLESFLNASYSQRDIDTYIKCTANRRLVREMLTVNATRRGTGDIYTPLRLKTGDGQVNGEELVALCPREEIESILVSLGCSKEIDTSKKGRKRGKTPDILVIPFYNLPGQLTTLELCNPDPEDTGSLRRVNIYKPHLSSSFTPGIAAFTAISNSDPKFGDDLFVFFDAVLATKLQIEKLRISSGYLPIVAVDREATPTDYFKVYVGQRKIIFWTPQLSSSVFNHVKVANGMISHYLPSEDVYKFARRYTHSQLLDMLRRNARPWEAVLEDWLSTMSFEDTQRHINQIHWCPEELPTFIGGCAKTLRTRLEKIGMMMRDRTYIIANDRKVIETSRGWEDLANGRIISEVTYKIDRIITYRYKQSLYEGTATYRSQTLPFRMVEADIAWSALSKISKMFVQQHIGVPNFDRAWQRDLLNVTQKLHPPEILKGFDYSGWDEDRAVIVTYDYILNMGGEITKHVAPAPEAPHSAQLPLPVPFTEEDIKNLNAATYTGSLSWRMMGYILHNILSYVYRYPTAGIVVYGISHDDAITVAKALGCPMLPPSTKITSLLKEQCASHWPMIAEGLTPLKPKVSHWLQESRRDIIVQISCKKKNSLDIPPQWKCVLTSDDQLNKSTVESIRKAMPLFLQAIAIRRMVPWHNPEKWTLDDVFHNLGLWYSDVGGSVAAVDHAYRTVIEDIPDALQETSGSWSSEGL
jgi:hypothetical protein